MKKDIKISILDIPVNLSNPDKPPEGITISGYKKTMSLDGEGLITLTFVVQMMAGIPFDILAAWIYDKFYKLMPPSTEKKIIINKKTRTFIRSKDLEILIEEETQSSEEG
jgi:hypothetical protein